MNATRLLALLLCAAPAAAQDAPKTLRWGGDKNGGAPFIFETALGELTGFEVELAAYFGRELGRTPVFVQNQWDNVPDLLKRPRTGGGDDIDVAMNGFEFSPERHAESPTTVPYFIYSFRLIVNVEDREVDSWSALGLAKTPKQVGVLRGTASEKYVEERYGEKVELKTTETVTEMLENVSLKRVHTTVQDSPAAGYYVLEGRFPKLKVVDEGVGHGYYCVLTRPEDKDLRDGLNAAIRKAARTGFLKDLYKKYGLWDAHQQRLSYLAEQPWPEAADELRAEAGGEKPVAGLNWGVVRENLVLAVGMTILLAVTSFPLAMAIGVVVATARVYGPRWLRIPAAAYVELFRGTPLLLQLFVLFYLLPELGRKIGGDDLAQWMSLPSFTAAVLGLALNYSAAEAENYRAGLLAVPKGQMEAALSLGFTWRTAMRRVVLPQAFRVVVPPVTNDFIALFKDTAVCSTLLIVELTGLYYKYKTYPGAVIPLAAAVAGLYLLMSYPLSLLAGYAERRLAGPGGQS